MEATTVNKRNFIVGIIVGIITPIAVVLIQFIIKQNSGITWNEFYTSLLQSKTFLTGVSTIALIANGLLFGILNMFKKFETAKGVFIPTVLLSLGVLLYKLF